MSKKSEFASTSAANISEKSLFHCKKPYYKIIKGRKLRKIMCNLKINVYHGTFEGTYMDLAKICRFIAYFLMLQPPRHKFLMIELQMNDSVVIDWMNFYREVNYKILFYTVHLYLSLCNVCLLNEL